MRIATWNINGLRARIEFFLRWLEDREPDIVGLQELKLANEEFPHGELRERGYEALVHGQKAWNGVAVVSRRPSSLTQTGLPGQEAFGSRLISAEVEGISFTTVYAPNGKSTGHEDFPRKLAWFDSLAGYFAERGDPAQPAVLCGDFNVCPAPIDSWNEDLLGGSVFHTEEERVRYRRLLERGWEDVFRVRHPDVQAFSWWDYRAGAFHKRQGLRIDMLLASAPLMARVRHVEIDRDYRKKKDGLTPSDHAPVFADLA